MASYTCPKCNITLKKGSWELVSDCPDCHTPWEVDLRAPEKSLRRVQILAALFAILSFVPYLGLVFGILGVFWSYLAIKFRHVTLGVTLMVVSTVVGLVGQGALVYYELGVFEDRNCEQRLALLGTSIRQYREKNRYLPESLEVLDKAKFKAPQKCFAGGKYFYLPPWNWNWKAGDVEATTAPTVLQVDVLKAMTQQAASAPAMKAPAPSEPTIPEAWTAGIPKEYQAALMGAKLDVVQLPPLQEITEAKNPSTVMMATEVIPSHRYIRTCLMADYTVRTLSPEGFRNLLAQPQNQLFARVLEGARKAEGDQTIGKQAKKLADERAKARGEKAPKPEAEAAPRGSGH